MYSILIDCILVIIILFYYLMGIKKGLIKSFFNFFGTIVAIILSIYLANFLAKWVYVAGFEQSLTDYLKLAVKNNVMRFDSFLAFVLDTVKNFDSKKHLIIIDIIAKNKSNAAEKIVQLIAPLMTQIIKFILTIVFYLIIKMFFKYFSFGLSKVFKIPILHQIDGFLGGIFGALKGVLVATFLVFLINFFSPLINAKYKIFLPENVNSSVVYNFFKDKIIKNEFFDSLIIKSEI